MGAECGMPELAGLEDHRVIAYSKPILAVLYDSSGYLLCFMPVILEESKPA